MTSDNTVQEWYEVGTITITRQAAESVCKYISGRGRS